MFSAYLFLIGNLLFAIPQELCLPILVKHRKNPAKIELTEIGKFGVIRKARKDIPKHYHTGIDFKRQGKNYKDEPIFPILKGKIISKRTDGPYAQLIIEHKWKGEIIWTLYEHIAGIKVRLNDAVGPETPIARFMNQSELNKYGWQFDHFHFEILREKPQKLKPDKNHPDRLYNSFTLQCDSIEELLRYYYDPLVFFRKNLGLKHF